MDSEVDADIKTLSLPASTTISATAKTLLDDANVGAMRDTLGLGTLAQKSEIDDIDQIAAGVKLVAGESFVDSDDNLMTAAAIDDRINSAAAVTSYTNTGDNRVLTSVGGTTINGESNLTFDGNHLDITSGHLELPYGEINDAGTDMNIVSTNALTLGTESGTALTLANASTVVAIANKMTLPASHSADKITMYSGGNEKIGTEANTLLFTADNYKFKDTNGDVNLFMNNSGNVGIGVVSPASKLHVEGKAFIGEAGGYETEFPSNTASLHIHEVVNDSGGVDLGNEAHMVISTGVNATGAQGYQGSLWFGTSDHPAAIFYK